MKTITVTKKASDSDVVHLSGTEVITGAKSFTTAPTVPTGETSLNDSQAASTMWVKNVVNQRFPKWGYTLSYFGSVVASGVFTAPYNGWVLVQAHSSARLYLSIQNETTLVSHTLSNANSKGGFFPLKAGDVMEFVFPDKDGSFFFIPTYED